MNRNKLTEAFISNLANAVIHEVLEKAIDKEEISQAYNKEIRNSSEIAKKYREKINPVNRSLPETDIEEIKRKIINKVNSELKLRINKGYENINLLLVDELVDKYLKEMKVS
ncbi:hypothetical protein J4405_02690 [Candidatus Woesearchaeota archaeon]|nr:hypothetical protein [Candidatus Woesearchaeota archaeon]